MFRPMAQTVSFAILGAFILSLTYVPMMSALFLKKTISTKRTISDRIISFFHRLYEPVLQFALRAKMLFVGVVLEIGRESGRERVSRTCRSWWSPFLAKKKLAHLTH